MKIEGLPLLLVLFLFAAAIFIYNISFESEDGLEKWERWGAQASGLIAVSIAITVISLFLSSFGTRFVLTIVLVGFFTIGAYGEGSFSLPLFAWGTALIILVFEILPFRLALVASSAVFGVAVFFPRATSGWEVSVATRLPSDLFINFVYFLVVYILAIALSVYRSRESSHRLARSQLQDALLQITTANVGFQDYAEAAQQRGMEEERQRITREIHDTIGYTLTNIMMMTTASRELIDRDHSTLRKLLEDARLQCQEALSETRRTLRAFRAMQQPEIDFPNHLWKTVNTFEIATGITTQLEFRNLPPLRDRKIELVLHRTVQEGLTNAFRHGHATHISILFWYDGEGVTLTIRDNGIGSAKVQEDIGLQGMRERFQDVGGTVYVQTIPGSGFEVQGWIPFKNTMKTQD